MSGVVIGGGYYSVPTLVLASKCYFVLTTLIYKFIQIVRAISESVSRTQSTGESPMGSGHYILDLRPEHGRERRTSRRTPGDFIGGGYSIPTIALANISQLVMTTLTDFSSNCAYGGLRVVLWTVLGITQLQVRPSDGEEAREEPPDTVVQNHYIFDLRPQYGSDIIEMFHDILENNWPVSLVPHFRKHRKRSKRKYIYMSGWRPKLVNLERKKRTKNSLQPTKTVNHQYPKIQSSLLHSIGDMDNNNFSHSEERQVGIQMSIRSIDQGSDVFYLEERLDIELPIKVTDEDTDIEVQTFTSVT